MRMLFTLLCILLSSLAFTLSAQIYVDQSTTAGANDGTSWEDAYTDLKQAIADAPANSTLWVAMGKYKPDTLNGSAFSSFFIDKDLVLLGGFNGTETSADQRDPVQNETVLSGDLNDDDLPNNFSTNIGDNVMSIIRVETNVTNATIIDGFTIRNGVADGGINNYQQNGGAIYSLGGLTIRNCRFVQNQAISNGGAIFITNSFAEGTSIENCIFEKNRAVSTGNTFGGAIAAENVKGEGIQLLDCVFIDNYADWAGAVNLRNSSALFDGVTFTSNTTPRQGGAIRYFPSTGDTWLTILNCAFQENAAAFGGAVHMLVYSDNNEITVQNTSFLENTTAPVLSGWGSGASGLGIFIDTTANNTLLLIEDCTFHGQVSKGNGAGIQIGDNGTASDTRVLHSDFSQNSNEQNGSAIFMSSARGNGYLEIKGCDFTGNTSLNEATLDVWVNNGGSGEVLIDSCFFENDSALYAGALAIGTGWGGEGAQLQTTISNCQFINNTAMEGGALLIWSREGNSHQAVVENCIIDGNTASFAGGGITTDALGDGFNLTIRNTYLTNNQCPLGSALYNYPYFSVTAFPDDVSIILENCLVAGNTGESPAIQVDSLPSLHLLNCTVAGNIGGGIGLENQSNLTLQNTILYNPGYPDFVDLTNDGSAASNQGNLIFDNSLDAILQPLDKTGIDPGFMPGTYEPAAGSPLINAGINGGVTAPYDIAGNDRIKGGFVDIGAYESDLNLSAKNLLGAAESLALSPNPATESVFATLPDEFSFPGLAEIIDASGNTVSRPAFVPGNPVAVGELPAGMYTLKITGEGRVYAGRFVKQ